MIQLALIHYQFETIHPLMDGNDRMGRLLIPLILLERGYLQQPLLSLSAYFDRRKDAYKDAILAVSQRSAWVEWIDFFLEGVIERSRDAIVLSDRLLALRQQYRDRVIGPRTSATLLGLVDSLFESPAVTAREVADRCQVAPKAAYQLIGKLVDFGILREATGRSYNRIFLASGIVRATLPEDRPS